MKLKRILGWTALAIPLTLFAVVFIAYWMSDNTCGDPAAAAPGNPVKAIVFCDYGTADVLELEDVEKPVPGDEEILVRVRAAAVNPLDWHFMRGTPYIVRLSSGLRKPQVTRLGVDFAGTVEAVGKNVTRLAPGDDVFGGKTGAFGEYVTVREDSAVVPKPPGVTFEQAASVPIAAVTALQALRDAGKIQPGQNVLINGASGGVGTFAVQLAKHFGAHVTGVCSTRNLEMVRSIGADEVIDYTGEDFTEGERRYDLILDMVGNRALSEMRRVMKPGGKAVLVGGGGPDAGNWIGPLAGPIKAMLYAPFVSEEFLPFLAQLNQEDLTLLGHLIESGEVTPVIDRRYRLSEVPEAIWYLEEGHARGKVIITVAAEDAAGPVTALELESAVARIAAKHTGTEELWPGFDPLAVPLAVYDGEQTFLFRHPSPPEGFTSLSADYGTYVRDGRHESIVANTVVEIGGLPTATVLLDRFTTDTTLAERAAVAVHEVFHAWQNAHHPGWFGNEAHLFTYPTDSVELLALRRQETEALRRALAAETDADGACWARTALAIRSDRDARMEPAFSAYERGTELNEGLAYYVQARAASRRTVELPAAGFDPTEVRHRSSEAGTAIAWLLDQFAPGWKVNLAADEEQTLAAVLSAAVGSGETCAFHDAAVAELEMTAEADVAALLDERTQRLAEFQEKAGWRVVVEVMGGDPLMPQGFDPLNVEPLDAKRTLHTRFLRLGSGAGKLEVMNATAMTEGAGSHPLFQGVRRVTLTGLAKPQLTQAEGHVSVKTSGLTLEFDGATIEQADQTITVQL